MGGHNRALSRAVFADDPLKERRGLVILILIAVSSTAQNCYW